MATDIELGPDSITLIAYPQTPGLAGRVTCWAADIELDGGIDRRGGKPPGPRRAIVHYFEDVLVLNYAGDYPGGARVAGSGLTVESKLMVKTSGTLWPSVWPGTAATTVTDVEVVKEIASLRDTIRQLRSPHRPLSLPTTETKRLQGRNRLHLALAWD